jgi:two-component system CheB/CheR fusion protein
MAETSVDSDDLDGLLGFIRESRGFDFSGYKQTTLIRRINRRMHDVGTGSYDEYRDLLEANVDEFRELFDTILINVTSFFRDAEAWEYLRSEILPRIIASGEEIRMWSAGCSSGEEAYSLAIALAEALGPDAFLDRVKERWPMPGARCIRPRRWRRSNPACAPSISNSPVADSCSGRISGGG